MSQPFQASDKLLVWGVDNIDGKALAQAAASSTMRFIPGHVALMPDAHWGMGATVGSVIPTDGAIIPAAVGVDIGCGMIAVNTGLTSSDLPNDLTPLLHGIEQAVPAGLGKWHDEADALIESNDNVVKYGLAERASQQVGTLGSGNHFVEVSLDPGEGVWVVLHSGSRGVGNKLAMRHIRTAKKLMKQYFIDLPDPDLAYFAEHTPEFGEYLTDLMWAQRYALKNREVMMDNVLEQLQLATGKEINEWSRINSHHNYTAREEWYGKKLWITRKGAISAKKGELGIIPGSMGTDSFIVRGLGNKASFNSSAHGAGRAMSRTQAKKDYDGVDLEAAMAGKTWLADKSKQLVDEIPQAYKDIHQVMEDQSDLVEIETQLIQILNYKGA